MPPPGPPSCCLRGGSRFGDFMIEDPPSIQSSYTSPCQCPDHSRRVSPGREGWTGTAGAPASVADWETPSCQWGGQSRPTQARTVKEPAAQVVCARSPGFGLGSEGAVGPALTGRQSCRPGNARRTLPAAETKPGPRKVPRDGPGLDGGRAAPAPKQPGQAPSGQDHTASPRALPCRPQRGFVPGTRAEARLCGPPSTPETRPREAGRNTCSLTVSLPSGAARGP